MATAQYRTLLEQIVHESPWTVDETCQAFELKARQMQEPATLSPRQLARWMRGDVGQARSVSKRVAEAFWGHRFDVLLGSPDDVPEFERYSGTAAPGLSVDVESLEAAAVMAAHESFEHAARIAGTVDSDDISLLQESVLELARGYQAKPPLQLLTEARHIRNVAYLMLDKTRRPAQTSELYQVAGQACGLLSVVSFDLARWDAAEEQARSARTYAELIGDAHLEAWSRGTQAFIANWRGHSRRAVDLVASSVENAPAGVATARLRAIEARAWAELGHPDRVKESLRLADIEMEQAPINEVYGATGGEFGWGPSRHAACAGTALVVVGQGESAAVRINDAITLAPEDPLGGLEPARAQIDLATAELLAGRLDASLDSLTVVWEIPAPHRRHGITGRMEQIARHLTGRDWRDTSEAVELRDQIEVFNSEAVSRLALPNL
ncbi:hypothetical protein E1263_05485 [Kribbella antibiotica]|uniref:XRE family transcriptional regulator n=1 Tax=Kribbella antibiotica TaxID=190195 RepID=A0A4R4ZV40_9ACTN|nr:hypothetical protein [Kribbella antibiotica]TDD62064.1 hypothetical protein E1263_05485 [Kribbella antibiotica]